MKKHIITLSLSSIALMTPFAVTSITACSPTNEPLLSVKVMSYNIQHGINHQFKEKGVELDPIVDTIKRYNPDIVNINEIYNKCSKLPISEQVKYIGEKLHYNYYFVLGDIIKWMDNGEYGGAILSRYPMTNCETHQIPDPSPGQTLEKRAVGKATITLPNNKKIDILQSHFGGISGEEDIRKKEWQNAVDTVLSSLTPNNNSIFMGDLNLVAGRNPDMYYINQLKARMNETIDESIKTFDSLHPDIHIDYMFCSFGMKFNPGFALVNERHSDHLPIIGRFYI